MNDEQRRQLYEVLDYDERTALAESFSTPNDALKLRVTSKLNKGSFRLRTDPHGEAKDIVSIVFDVFRANFNQRPEGFDTSISLGGFEVYDGTTKNSLYPQIVHVKESSAQGTHQDLLRKGSVSAEDPFFYLKFEKSPLDERADTALTMRMRHMEIIYHRGIVEAVYEFFRPPASQLESVEALLVSVAPKRVFPCLTTYSRMSPARLWKASGTRLGLGWNTLYKNTRRSTFKWISTLRSSSSQKSRFFRRPVFGTLH
jgi:vacuolar protein sorting-associated protein 13A/C